MSGGHFDYQEYGILRVSEDIEAFVEKYSKHNLSEWTGEMVDPVDPDICEKMLIVSNMLKEIYEYAKSIDYYISGDYGEDTIREKLKDVKRR